MSDGTVDMYNWVKGPDTGTDIGSAQQTVPPEKNSSLRQKPWRKDEKHTKAERMPRSKPKPTGLEYDLADLFLTQPDLQIFSHPQSGGGGDASTP